MKRLLVLLFVAVGCVVAGGLTGCGVSLSDTAGPSDAVQGSLRGAVHGGQQPVTGAHIYLYAAGTSGYGGASVSLLKAYSGGNYPTSPDANGNYYETTDSLGFFDLTGAYTCTPGQQVYLYSIGGNPGLAVNNAGLGLMAVLAQCPQSGTFVGTLDSILVNEISTIAAAYAMSGFATDGTHVSSSGTALANVGVANAFANAAQMYYIQGYEPGHTALAVTPGGNGAVPKQELITLADILASCVNSSGALTNTDGSETACGTLFSVATSDGTATGANPTDTATAAINIAHHPWAGVAALYALASSSPPYAGGLGSQPSDFSVTLYFTGGGLAASPQHLAIDAAGDVWTAVGGSAPAVIELSPLGTILSGAGYTAPSLTSPSDLRIDQQGNVWVLAGGQLIAEFSNTGTNLSGAGFTTAPSCSPTGLAVAADGSIWVDDFACNALTKLSSQGVLLGSVSESGYLANGTAIGIDQLGDIWAAWFFDDEISEFSATGVPATNTPYAVSARAGKPVGDGFGNIWYANFTTSLTEFSSSGQLLSGANGYPIGTGGSGNIGYDAAIDGGENVWVTAYYSGTLHEFSNAGVALNGPNGYSLHQGPFSTNPQVDGSGDIWVANDVNIGVSEMIGAAVPVVTPVSAGLVAPYTLGSRP